MPGITCFHPDCCFLRSEERASREYSAFCREAHCLEVGNDALSEWWCVRPASELGALALPQKITTHTGWGRCSLAVVLSFSDTRANHHAWSLTYGDGTSQTPWSDLQHQPGMTKRKAEASVSSMYRILQKLWAVREQALRWFGNVSAPALFLARSRMTSTYGRCSGYVHIGNFFFLLHSLYVK